MSSWLKKELRRANKENKRCKKLYSDWADDEFNCGPNKFIFGVITKSRNSQKSYNSDSPSFQTINDLQVYYNRDNRQYTLDIESNYSSVEDVKYLTHLLKEFKKFVMSSNNKMLCTDKELLSISHKDLYEYINFNTSYSHYWTSDNLIILYNKFYIFVEGYKKLCCAIDKNNKDINDTEVHN